MRIEDRIDSDTYKKLCKLRSKKVKVKDSYLGDDIEKLMDHPSHYRKRGRLRQR